MGTFSYAADDPKPETQIGFLGRYVAMVKKMLSHGEVEFDESRRKFMRNSAGAAAGAGVIASGGGGGVVASILEQIRLKTPKDVLRRLARLRVNNSSVIPLDKAGLSSYKKSLLKELSKTTNPHIRLVIQERLNQMDQAFNNQDLLNSITDNRPNLDDIFMDNRQRRRLERRLQKARDKLIANGKLQGLELLVMTARTLLDDVLLRKIAYQIQFVNPEKDEFSVVFTEEEFKTIRQYSTMINSLEKSQLKHFSHNSFLSQWLPLLRHEVNLAIEMYEVSKYGISGSTSVRFCKALL
jgi:hypothetical protein